MTLAFEANTIKNFGQFRTVVSYCVYQTELDQHASLHDYKIHCDCKTLYGTRPRSVNFMSLFFFMLNVHHLIKMRSKVETKTFFSKKKRKKNKTS
jgi:hypothetical protein